jgi:hypothetical protein
MTLGEPTAAREPLPRHRWLFRTFVEEVRRRFAFLADHGWSEHDARWPSVEYRSPSLRLVISLVPAHSSAYFFVDGEFEAAISSDRSLIPLQELYTRSHPEMTNRAEPPMMGGRDFPANDGAEIAGSLERMATLLRTKGRELVEHRPRLLEEVRRDRLERAQELDLNRGRPRANAAFKAGDWTTVVRELEPFENRLRRSERMKLAYARRRL